MTTAQYCLKVLRACAREFDRRGLSTRWFRLRRLFHEAREQMWEAEPFWDGCDPCEAVGDKEQLQAL